MRIAVIGGGFSGTMTAVHLLRLGGPDLEVFLIERRPYAGRGVAYGTPFPGHLLNVPAGKMSAYPDKPDHFIHWWSGHPVGSGPKPTDFAPRQVYGAYLGAQLEGAEHDTRAKFHRVRDEAVDLHIGENGLQVSLEGGESVEADKAVLAIGNFPPAHPPIEDRSFYSSSRYVGDPWSRNNLAGLSASDAVLLIGTGLTAVDLALALEAEGHSGKIYMLSRRAQLPQPHALPGEAQTHPPFLAADSLPTSTRQLVRVVRRELAAAAEKGIGWRAVLDAIRPVTQQLWQGLPHSEKNRFMKHVRGFWEVRRHRMPPAVSEAVARMRTEGRLELLQGRLTGFEEDEAGVDVVWKSAGSSNPQRVRVQRVINCTGPESDYRRMRHPLVVSLLGQGCARPDAMNLGLDVSENGALRDLHGEPSSVLFTLGPLCKGTLWETTAVPEIRVQAQALAQTLLAK